ncbi:MAG: STAS domain-containing protein [Planctomycetes bacterium]|nr:STAS domain-containing protein [Planctomycetota bacterium]
MAYTLERAQIGDVTVLSLSGRFGQDAAEELLAKVTALAVGVGIVVDLSGVEYISSAAIGCLVQIGVDRGAVIAAPSEAVRRTFELAEVGAFLRILPGLDEARAAATGRSSRRGPA